MHCYDINEALYQYFEIHVPMVRGSCPRGGPMLPYSKNVLVFGKFSSLLPHVGENLIHGYVVHEFLYLNLWAESGGQYGHIL